MPRRLPRRPLPCLPRAGRAGIPNLILAALAVTLLLAGCSGRPPDGRIRIVYWEKWTGQEAASMQAVVDAFNTSQDRIRVDYLSVAQIDRKTIVATAGGAPPDVAGVWIQNVGAFADNNALLPLDDLIRRHTGLEPAAYLERFSPAYARLCTYDSRVYALLSTPTTLALHWNKTLFREAGLDPDRPPRTLAELEEFSRKLTRRDPATGRLTQVGFLPQEPGWWPHLFLEWLGGSLYDGRDVTIGTDPKNLEAFEWVASFSRELGVEEIKVMTAGFGGFASPQSAFFSGRVAMVIQGVWLNNYLRQFAPGLDYGVAALPVAVPGVTDFTYAEADVLVIPRGSRHPEAAFEFLHYVNSHNPNARTREELQGMELVCFLQEKASPLRDWSPFFTEHHPHPDIDVFRRLADSPNATRAPSIGIWTEYQREVTAAFENVRLLRQTPAEALAYAHGRISRSWTLHQRSMERHRALSTLNPSLPAPIQP